MRSKCVALLAVSSAILSACSTQLEQDGTLVQVEDQLQWVRDEDTQKRLCAVHYCEPNWVVHAYFGKRRYQPAPDPVREPVRDPSSQPAREAYAHRIMNVGLAWSRTQGNASTTIAVIDSGIELSHPDLRGHLSINAAEAQGRPGVDDDQNGLIDDVHGYDFHRSTGAPHDESGHGTHVAGIVHQVAPQAKVLSLKFIDVNGRGNTFNAIRAIDYAIQQRVQVINASWGGNSYSNLLDQAVQRAVRAGITFVAAAGNEGRNVDGRLSYPANLDNVISVGSSDSFDHLSSFSNYGNRVTLIAPGEDILSTVMGGSWDTLSGTSMAAPQVAGAVGLLKSLQPQASPTSIQQTLCQSADAFTSDVETGPSQCGRVNIGRAVSRF